MSPMRLMWQDAYPGVRRGDDVKRGYYTRNQYERAWFALTVLACQALGATSSPLEGCLR